MSMDAARLAPNNGRILNKLIDWLSDIINIIESRSNLFYFIVDVSATSVAFVEMTSGSDFLRKMSLLRRKVRRRDMTRYMSPVVLFGIY